MMDDYFIQKNAKSYLNCMKYGEIILVYRNQNSSCTIIIISIFVAERSFRAPEEVSKRQLKKMADSMMYRDKSMKTTVKKMVSIEFFSFVVLYLSPLVSFYVISVQSFFI